MTTSLYESPELTELGVLNVDTLSGTNGASAKKNLAEVQVDCHDDRVKTNEEELFCDEYFEKHI